MRSLLVLLVFAAASDAELARYHVRPDVARDAVFGALSEPYFAYPAAPDALHALDGPGRAAAVKVLGAFARAYFESGSFQHRWAEARARAVGKEPVKRTYEQAVAARRAQLEQQLRTTEAALSNLPPEQRKEMHKTMAQTRANLEQQLLDRKAVEDDETRSFEGAKYLYDMKSKQWPADPKEKLVPLLQKVLAETEAVDFNAPTMLAQGGMYFIDPKNQKRSRIWKLAFRAGPEATQAAREVAQAWLASLR